MESKSADEAVDSAPFLPTPVIDAKDVTSLARAAELLRAEVMRRWPIAQSMRYGKARAQEFGYIAGLNDAAALLIGESFYMSCPVPTSVIFDGTGDFDKTHHTDG